MIATPTDASSNTTTVECSVCFNWSWSFPNGRVQKNDIDVLDQSIHDPSLVQMALSQSDIQLDAPTKFDWEDTFFKKFDWLQESSNNYVLDMSSSNISVDSSSNLYFISLNNECMFLYHCEKKENDQDIMDECLLNYEYVQINRPRKIVFTLKNVKSCEVDEIVELFMCQFGIDKTRGGSYTDLELSDNIHQILTIKFKTMNPDLWV